MWGMMSDNTDSVVIVLGTDYYYALGVLSRYLLLNIVNALQLWSL